MRRLIMSRLIWIYAVCKSLLLSPVAMKEINKTFCIPTRLSVLHARSAAFRTLSLISSLTLKQVSHSSGRLSTTSSKGLPRNKSLTARQLKQITVFTLSIRTNRLEQTILSNSLSILLLSWLLNYININNEIMAHNKNETKLFFYTKKTNLYAR